MSEWQPIETCPDDATVLFCWPDGQVEKGRMQHDQERVGGYKKDYFWGGIWSLTADEHPPEWWMPVLAPPTEQGKE